MSRTQRIAEALARAIATSAISGAAVIEVFRAVLGKNYRFAPKVAARLISVLGQGKRVREFRVRRWLLADPGFLKACAKHRFPALRLHSIADHDPEMLPAPSIATTWQIPAIVTTGDLARWLDVEMPRLLWLADARTLEPRTPAGPLRNYRYRWFAKRSGSARLIESPKLMLKTLQRRILHYILDAIPPHEAAHGFRSGRSIVSFAAPHVAQAMVLRMDLSDFFPSISRARVLALFMTAGYPEKVAAMLANLCVNTTPRDVILDCAVPMNMEQRRWLRQLYDPPHLPQGAPTSPALANLCAYRLDCRLSGLAKACGAAYTRYADDLVFSGGEGFRRCVERFHVRALAIAMEEGFKPNTRKTAFMSAATSQHIASIVINRKLTTARDDFDLLKATLHNCAKHGPASQNRLALPHFREHLMGRIAHVAQVNPARGAKLRAVFEQVNWLLP